MRPEGLAGDYVVEFLPDALPHGLADPHRSLARVYVGADPPAGAVYLHRRAIRTRTAAEACVFMLAHELRHLEQAEHGLRIRTEPKERDADAYAARFLRRWRRSFTPTVKAI